MCGCGLNLSPHPQYAEFTDKIMSKQSYAVETIVQGYVPRLQGGMKCSYFPHLDVSVVSFPSSEPPVFDCSFTSLLAAAADAGRRHNDRKQSIRLGSMKSFPQRSKRTLWPAALHACRQVTTHMLYAMPLK